MNKPECSPLRGEDKRHLTQRLLDKIARLSQDNNHLTKMIEEAVLINTEEGGVAYGEYDPDTLEYIPSDPLPNIPRLQRALAEADAERDELLERRAKWEESRAELEHTIKTYLDRIDDLERKTEELKIRCEVSEYNLSECNAERESLWVRIEVLEREHVSGDRLEPLSITKEMQELFDFQAEAKKKFMDDMFSAFCLPKEMLRG